MLEDFLQEIYDKAISIEYLKETSHYAQLRKPYKCRELWNDAIKHCKIILDDLRVNDQEKYIYLLKKLEVTQLEFSNILNFAALIDNEVIPFISEYLQAFTGIEVTDGNWNISSAKTGFLTIKNMKGVCVHSPLDPMWESFQFAESIYDPTITRYNILGCGLGYLAYQLWRISDGEADIFIYETDSKMRTYSDLYGVLNYIDGEKLHFIYDEDTDRVIEHYCLDSSDDRIVRTINYWDFDSYNGAYSTHLKTVYNCEVTKRLFDSKWKSNYAKNMSLPYDLFSNCKKEMVRDEWVVVAAGPSLNDNEAFIKESKGKRTICSINASLKWFYIHDVLPDLCTVCDPLDDLVPHIEGFEDFSCNIPLIADCIANHRFIKLYRGPKYYIVSDSSTDLADGALRQEPVWSFGGTVTSMAIEVAFRMGAKKIYFVGADLSYPGRKTYADGVGHEVEVWNNADIKVASVEDTAVPTSNVFCDYIFQIENQIAEHPDVEVVNKSIHGAYFRGTFCDQWWETLPESHSFEDYQSYFEKLNNKSMILGWKDKYYIFRQLLGKMDFYDVIPDAEGSTVIGKAYMTIYEELKEKFNWANSLEYKRNNNLVYIFTDEFLDDKDLKTKEILERTEKEFEKKHAVLIVNTAEKSSMDVVPIHNKMYVKYNDKMKNAEKVSYMGKSYPYFQLPEGMPDIEYYKVFMNIIANNLPQKIVSLCRYSLLADLCSEYWTIDKV